MLVSCNIVLIQNKVNSDFILSDIRLHDGEGYGEILNCTRRSLEGAVSIITYSYPDVIRKLRLTYSVLY